MSLSYKNKLKVVSDEQFNNPFNEKDKIKLTLQKGLFVTIAISMLIYLSKLL